MKYKVEMIVEVNEDEDLEIPDSFIWVTFNTPKEFGKIYFSVSRSNESRR